MKLSFAKRVTKYCAGTDADRRFRGLLRVRDAMKTFRVFKRWPGFVVYAVIMSALVLGLGYDLFGLVPDPKTEVQSLSIGPDVDVELRIRPTLRL